MGPKPVGYANYPNNIGTIATNNGGSFDGPAYIMAANLIPTLAQGGTVTLATITDGTSNTVIFSEWIKADLSTTSTSGLEQIMVSPDAYPATNTYVLPTVYSADCQSSLTISPANENVKGCFWYNDKCGQGGGYSHISTPNLKACLFSNDADAATGPHGGRGQLESSRRRERRASRRLGPLHQELDQPADLVGARRPSRAAR